MVADRGRGGDGARARSASPRSLPVLPFGAMPYREMPPIPTSERCEICGRPGAHMRCAACEAVTVRLFGLEIPVVAVMCNWWHDDPIVGIGLVLVDRWYEIASCACQLTLVRPAAEVDLFAHARAALWAPTARIADTTIEHNNALKDTLRRTRAADHRAVRDRFHAAVESAVRLAQAAFECGRMVTRIEPEAHQ
jgi:hypothetical protein